MRAFNRSIILLSVQEVLACGGSPTNKYINGCKSGFYSDVYDYAVHFGIGPSISYPYENKAYNTGNISECSKSITGNKTYTKVKTFIKESVSIKYGDCH